eukprot:2335954-Rhodomonas_salina.1
MTLATAGAPRNATQETAISVRGVPGMRFVVYGISGFRDSKLNLARAWLSSWRDSRAAPALRGRAPPPPRLPPPRPPPPPRGCLGRTERSARSARKGADEARDSGQVRE